MRMQEICKEIEELTFKIAGDHYLVPEITVKKESDGIHIYLDTDVVSLEFLVNLDKELRKLGYYISDIFPADWGFDLLLQEI